MSRLREIAEASDWTKAAQLVTDSHICPDCVQFAVERAVQDQQWNFVLLAAKTHKNPVCKNIVIEEYKKKNQWQSLLFRQAIQAQLCDLVFDLCKHGVLRDDLKFAASQFLSGDADCETFNQFLQHVQEDERLWLKEYAIEFTLNEYFRLKSRTSKNIFLRQIPFNFCKQSSRDLFTKAIDKCLEHDTDKCLEHDCVTIFIELCKKRCPMDYDMMAKSKLDFVQAYKYAVEKGPNYISRLCFEKISKQGWCSLKELKLLIDIVVEKKAWDVLEHLSEGLPTGHKAFVSIMLRYCADMGLLSNQSLWGVIAPKLNIWIVRSSIRHAYSHPEYAKDWWSKRVTGLKQWCVDNGQANLAFFLAVVTMDWKTVEKVATPPTTLNLSYDDLRAAVMHAARNDLLSIGVLLLKTITPINDQALRAYIHCPLDSEVKSFANFCKEHDLLDWALVFHRNDLKYIQEHRRRCQNQVVLKWILDISRKTQQWDIALELLNSFDDTRVLKEVLQQAVLRGEAPIAEDLISRVDPTYVDDESSLLYFAVIHFQCNTKIVRLCIKSGLSSFHRDIPRNRFRCPLFLAVEKGRVPLIELLLASGICGHRALNEITQSRRLQYKLSHAKTNEQWKEGYMCVEEAAATPCRLEHLTRLVVSHRIGCRPGRSNRINRLPIPEQLKDLIHFKDVLGKK